MGVMAAQKYDSINIIVLNTNWILPLKMVMMAPLYDVYFTAIKKIKEKTKYNPYACQRPLSQRVAR